jgi:hypothetical protein
MRLANLDIAKAKEEAEKKEIAMILEMNEDEIPIKQIAKFIKKTEEVVCEII